MALKEWMFAVHDAATGQHYMGKDVSGWLMVCTAGAATSPTIYTNRTGSTTLTATNTVAVLSITNGYCQFWTANDVTSLDVSYLTSTGECGIRRSVSPTSTGNMLRVDTSYSGPYNLWVPFAFIASSAFVDTTLDLPADLEIFDAGIKVVGTDASASVDLGFKNATESGDEDGLLDGMVTDNAGYVTPWGVITNGSNIDYLAFTAGKYGALLATTITGSDAAATVGGLSRKNYITDGTIKSLGYTPSNSDTMTGFFIVSYRKQMG